MSQGYEAAVEAGHRFGQLVFVPCLIAVARVDAFGFEHGFLAAASVFLECVDVEVDFLVGHDGHPLHRTDEHRFAELRSHGYVRAREADVASPVAVVVCLFFGFDGQHPRQEQALLGFFGGDERRHAEVGQCDVVDAGGFGADFEGLCRFELVGGRGGQRVRAVAAYVGQGEQAFAVGGGFVVLLARQSYGGAADRQSGFVKHLAADGREQGLLQLQGHLCIFAGFHFDGLPFDGVVAVDAGAHVVRTRRQFVERVLAFAVGLVEFIVIFRVGRIVEGVAAQADDQVGEGVLRVLVGHGEGGASVQVFRHLETVEILVARVGSLADAVEAEVVVACGRFVREGQFQYIVLVGTCARVFEDGGLCLNGGGVAHGEGYGAGVVVVHVDFDHVLLAARQAYFGRDEPVVAVLFAHHVEGRLAGIVETEAVESFGYLPVGVDLRPGVEFVGRFETAPIVVGFVDDVGHHATPAPCA